ncbi:MAG: hypothetical protein Q9169_008507 [Polycauliona sp. 2 TL-2023]
MPVSDDNPTDQIIQSINEFLLSMKDTLLDLWILLRDIFHTETLLSPLAAGIINHGKSLLRLTADVRSSMPVTSARSGNQRVGWFDAKTWEGVGASMGRLEQLYVPFPPIVADGHMTARDEYYSYLDTALQIPTLETLNMTTWPYPLGTILLPPDDFRHFERVPYIVGPFSSQPRKKGSYLPGGFYDHCLKYIADFIVQRRHSLISNPPKPLRVVGFGLLERDHYMKNLRDMLKPVYFVQSDRPPSDGEMPILEQWSHQEILRMRAPELLSGVVDIDWLAKKPMREVYWDV